MALHVEPLTGGLVTARDPSLLTEGELVVATNAIYRPFNQALSPIKGRATYDTAIGATISGLRAIPFEANQNYVIIATGTVWQTNIAGVWTNVRTSVTTGNRIEAIHYNAQYYLSNGVNSPQTLLDAVTVTINHGMTATDANDIDMSTGPTPTGGDWSVVGVDQYEYWITEYDSNRQIESASASPTGGTNFNLGSPGSTTGVVNISIPYGQAAYPTLHNSNANKWRIYRGITGVGDPAPANYATSFPFGVLIREISIPGSPAVTTTTDPGIVSSIPYGSLTISVAGAGAVSISRDSVPPTWSTGDVFEDSLVVNDISDKSIIRYSFPGLPHSFPSLYFMGFETKQADEVKCIRAVNDVLIVGLVGQVWRVNYLPNETDSEFSRGRCKELISANHGIMGPDAACLFTPVEGTSWLAYVSHDGLYATDGLSTRLLTMDIDWENLVERSLLGSAILVNVPHLWSLFFYFVATGGSAPNNRMLSLSYHPQHLKENSFLKVAGPSTLTTRAADYLGPQFKALAADTNVVQEDATAGANTMAVRTRFIYPQGSELSTETSIERVRILTGAFTGGTHNIAFRKRKSNQADATETSKAFVPSTTENRLINAELHTWAEAIAIVLNSQADIHYVGLEYRSIQGE